MSEILELRYTGSLAPNGQISMRTLSHSLPSFQRAIDKTVFYNQFGQIRKFSMLSGSMYEKADLYMHPHREGSVIIPWAGDKVRGAIETLDNMLREPYRKANLEPQYNNTLAEQAENIRERVLRGDVNDDRLYDLILKDEGDRIDKKFATARVLGDISQAVGPVKSRYSGENDSIILTTNVGETVRNYEFNKKNLKGFEGIVTERNLGEPMRYRGTLDGLKKNSQKGFPHVGDFRCSSNKQLVKLLVPEGFIIKGLNKYNLTDTTFEIWASPIAQFGGFDQIKGDIVFLSMV